MKSKPIDSKPFDTGGPAFPIPSDGATHGTWEGMTLRDYFAGRAMQSLTRGGFHEGCTGFMEATALRAFKMADFMIAARKVQS